LAGNTANLTDHEISVAGTKGTVFLSVDQHFRKLVKLKRNHVREHNQCEHLQTYFQKLFLQPLKHDVLARRRKSGTTDKSAKHRVVRRFQPDESLRSLL
jgi:hypothetical protein